MIGFLGLRGMLALLLAGLVVSVYLRFQFLEHRHAQDAAALAHANQMRAAAEAQVRLNQVATNAADRTQRVNRTTAAAVVAAQQDIAHAPDAHALYLAWTAGIERVRHADSGSAPA